MRDGCGGVAVVEQQQLDARGVLREHAEVDAAWQNGGAERRASAGSDAARADRRDTPADHAPFALRTGATFQMSRQ